MLRVCQLSGEEIARLDKEFVRTLQEKKYGNSVRALKWHLSEALVISSISKKDRAPNVYRFLG